MMLGKSHPLREFLDARSVRNFENGVALVDAMSKATQQTARGRKMRFPEVLEALLTSLVSAVQAGVPPGEWAEVGVVLADAMQRRLTITGENDH